MDLASRRFVDFPEGRGNRSIVDLFTDAGVQRVVNLEVVDVASALAMVRQRLGLAFVPEETIAAQPGLARVDLAEPPAGRSRARCVPQPSTFRGRLRTATHAGRGPVRP